MRGQWPFTARDLSGALGNPAAETTQAVKEGNLLGLPGALLGDVANAGLNIARPVARAVDRVASDPDVGPLLNRVAGAYRAGRAGDPAAATQYNLMNLQEQEARRSLESRERIAAELSQALPSFNPMDLRQVEQAIGIMARHDPEMAMNFALSLASSQKAPKPTRVVDPATGKVVYARDDPGGVSLLQWEGGGAVEAPPPSALVNLSLDPGKQGAKSVYDEVLQASGGDESLALAAMRGKAYKDPVSNIWLPGSDVDRRAGNDYMAVVSSVIGFEDALSTLANEAHSTGRMTEVKERLSQIFTGAGSPAYQLYESQLGTVASRLSRAVESGVMTQQDIERHQKRLATYAEAIREGEVSESARRKLKALWDELEVGYVSRFRPEDQEKARRAFRVFRAMQLADKFEAREGYEPSEEELEELLGDAG